MNWTIRIVKGTQVKPFGQPIGAGVNYYMDVMIVDGAKKDKLGFVRVPDLQDKGNGKATVDLPVPPSPVRPR